MRVCELIEILSTFGDDQNVVLFAGGEVYPLLNVSEQDPLSDQPFDPEAPREVELGGGWNPLSLDEDDEEGDDDGYGDNDE